MTLEEYKKKSGQSIQKNEYFRKLIVRVFLSIIFVLLILIITNISSGAKKFITKNLFETDFKFSSINKLYNKYFLSLNNEKEEDKTVNSNQNLEYTTIDDYYNGAKLDVNENYTVKLLKSGIVVYVGEKEEYGNTIIIQQSNGVDAWYGNIKDVSIKLYDYVEEGTIIGNVDKTLYLVFQKDGIFKDYNEFIK